MPIFRYFHNTKSSQRDNLREATRHTNAKNTRPGMLAFHVLIPIIACLPGFVLNLCGSFWMNMNIVVVPALVANGAYPLTTDVCLITRKNETNPNVQKMIDFILSDDGQEIIRRTGYAGLGK